MRNLHWLPTAREGNVLTGLCHSVHNRPHGYSFTAHPCFTARLLRILLGCFLVYNILTSMEIFEFSRDTHSYSFWNDRFTYATRKNLIKKVRFHQGTLRF